MRFSPLPNTVRCETKLNFGARGFLASASGCMVCGAFIMRVSIGRFKSRAYMGIPLAAYSRIPPRCGHESDVVITALIGNPGNAFRVLQLFLLNSRWKLRLPELQFRPADEFLSRSMRLERTQFREPPQAETYSALPENGNLVPNRVLRQSPLCERLLESQNLLR